MILILPIGYFLIKKLCELLKEEDIRLNALHSIQQPFAFLLLIQKTQPKKRFKLVFVFIRPLFD